MYERPDALASLLAAIDQEVDPYQSTRVARALRRVVVRDLDRRVCHVLDRCRSRFWNSASSDAPDAHVLQPSRVLAATLVQLRLDSRSMWIQGSSEIACRNFGAAERHFRRALDLTNGDAHRGALLSNIASACEGREAVAEAMQLYENAADRGFTISALFGYFLAARIGDVSRSTRHLAHLRAVWDPKLEVEVAAVARMFEARWVLSSGLITPGLRALRSSSSFGSYLFELVAPHDLLASNTD